jgi:hypothetical protein
MIENNFTSDSVVQAEVVASEFAGTETMAEPNFPIFSLEFVQDRLSAAVLEDSERHDGFTPKCFS